LTTYTRSKSRAMLSAMRQFRLPSKVGQSSLRRCSSWHLPGGNLDPTESFFNPTVPRKHVLAALVLNEPGVLAGVSNMFAARNYNIDSLVVGRTEIEDLSRMTITVLGDKKVVNQAKRQLEDMVPVVVVEELEHNDDVAESFVQRDFMIIKVATEAPNSRQELLQLVQLFEAKVVDISHGRLMMEISGAPSNLQRFIDLCTPYGIIELARTGIVAMQRTDKALSNKIQDGELVQELQFSREEMDDSALPPG